MNQAVYGRIELGAARGVLWALALSLPLWAGIVLIVWAVTR